MAWLRLLARSRDPGLHTAQSTGVMCGPGRAAREAGGGQLCRELGTREDMRPHYINRLFFLYLLSIHLHNVMPFYPLSVEF